ncbi:pollen-specific protein C13-like [Carex rostrata]
MAKLIFQCFAFMAVCLFSSVLLVNAMEFTVESRVYCDTCRAGFETSVTEFIPGVKVRLECEHYTSHHIEVLDEGVTDNTGTYRLKGQDGHEEDKCSVVLVESPRPDCKEISPGRDRAPAVLSTDTGMPGDKRFPNHLGYLKDKPLDVCGSVMKQYEEEEY